MSETAQNGKGSNRRPTNADRYNEEWERIFCKKGQHDLTQQATIDLLDYNGTDQWRPAEGGMAKPFHWNDKEYLYMYNLSSGEHAYYNATDDKFETEVQFS